MSDHEEEVARLHPVEECQKWSWPSKEKASFIHNECQDEGLMTLDEIYLSCLLKTLHDTPTPVTVGFFSPYKTRAHSLLNQIAGSVLDESIQKEESQRFRHPPGMSYLTLLWYFIFYQPVITQEHLQRKSTEFLFIEFSAWEYACSNQLWAGLVTNLCDRIRHHFGPLLLSFFHVVGSHPEFILECPLEEWRLKRRTCCVAGLGVTALLAGASLAASSFLMPGIRDGTILKYLGSSFALIFGSGFVLAIIPVIKHLVVSQKKKIERMANSEKFTKHLGFRSAVKSEIELLTSFIHYMEVFQRRHFRIVFKITSLDICYPEQVAGVLNAINTLLSDRDAPFIFILVVDPSNIVSCLEQASSMKGMADNGYLYLNRTVTLPFSIPEIAIKSKMRCLEETLQAHKGLINVIHRRRMDPAITPSRSPTTMAATPELDQHRIDNKASQHIHEAFSCFSNEQDCLYHYVPDVIIQMRRIVNTIPIMIRLMTQQDLLRPDRSPRTVAGWVVLANQWPCRLSWILHCMEERQGQPSDCKKLMGEVFKETRAELYSKHKELQNIMALDGDPKLFERFLSTDFPFTVQEGKIFLKFTVNLDHSIRYKMAELQALATYRTENGSKSGTNSEKAA